MLNDYGRFGSVTSMLYQLSSPIKPFKLAAHCTTCFCQHLAITYNSSILLTSNTINQAVSYLIHLHTTAHKTVPSYITPYIIAELSICNISQHICYNCILIRFIILIWLIVATLSLSGPYYETFNK